MKENGDARYPREVIDWWTDKLFSDIDDDDIARANDRYLSVYDSDIELAIVLLSRILSKYGRVVAYRFGPLMPHDEEDFAIHRHMKNDESEEMIGSGDDVDRTAKNPNRVTQPFDMIGKGEGMSEMEAKERYYWSKIRQALKAGDIKAAHGILSTRVAGWEDCAYLDSRLRDRVAITFSAGCATLGDPAPLDKEQDHE